MKVRSGDVECPLVGNLVGAVIMTQQIDMRTIKNLHEKVSKRKSMKAYAYITQAQKDKLH